MVAKCDPSARNHGEVRLGSDISRSAEWQLEIYSIHFARAGWGNYLSDPEVPAIISEAGHVGKPQPAMLGGKYGA
jgi:hypothetical protein